MKTILNVVFVIALSMVVNSAFSAGNLKLNVFQLNEVKALVNVSSVTNSPFNLSLNDDKGNIVYYQENEGAGKDFCKIFNFSELDNGTYKLKVVCDNLSSERLIQKSNNCFVIGDEMTTIKPFFGLANNILRYSYLNYNKENVFFRLYKNDTMFFEKTLGSEFSIQQALNLSKLDRGDYEAIVTAGDNQFVYNIEIK